MQWKAYRYWLPEPCLTQAAGATPSQKCNSGKYLSCHPERSEGSSCVIQKTTKAGFFAALTMTGVR